MLRPALIALAALTTLPALAQQSATNPRAYLGGAIGQARYSLDTSSALSRAREVVPDASNVQLDKSREFAFKIYAGYKLGEFLAVEAAGHSFGQPTAKVTLGSGSNAVDLTAKGRLAGASASLVGSLQMNERLWIQARLGALYVRGSGELADKKVIKKSDSTGFYGFGIEDRYARDQGFRLEYERADIENAKADVWSLGWYYTF